ncbi:MAG: hypothetical protein JWN62_193 [Acidimicrobiales bacterium]|nr:hypothetical protein [Acidimicrobiales bacterium]
MSRVTYPIVERLADEVIVTARSTVEAQQAAGEAMGGDCTIISVERVHEGGIGGFFATELVRVIARPSRFRRADLELDAAMTSAEELVSSLRVSSPQFADRLMSELSQPREAATFVPFVPEERSPSTFADHLPILDDKPVFDEPAVVDEVDFFDQFAPTEPADAPLYNRFGTPETDHPVVTEVRAAQESLATPAWEVIDRVVQEHAAMQSRPAAIMHRCSPDVDQDRSPVVVPRRLPHAVDARWSHQTLRAIGLPDRIVDLALLQRPVEGPQWIMALMGAFRTLCSPAPAGPTVLVGPSCANLARQLRLVSVGSEELAESHSSVAVANVSTNIARSAMNDRSVHLIVGGQWQHLASIPAQIVSAATEADLLDAVRACCSWNATLGWTLVDNRYERIDEFTLVAHVRSIVFGSAS